MFCCGVARAGLLLLALGWASFDPPPLARSFTCMELIPSILQYSTMGSFLFLQKYMRTESMLSSAGNVQLESALLVLDRAKSEPPLLSQGLSRLALVVSVIGAEHVEFSLLFRGFHHFDFGVLVCGMSCMGFVFFLPVVDCACFGLSLFLRSLAQVGLALLALGFASFNFSLLAQCFGCCGFVMLLISLS